MNHQWIVSGLTCGHCEHAATEAVRRVDPLATVRITRPSGRIQVESTQPLEVLQQAVTAAGYPPLDVAQRDQQAEAG